MLHASLVSLTAPAKKKAENGGKGMKRQKKKQKSSEDSDTDDLFTSKQNPVSIIMDRYSVLIVFH